MIRFAVFDFDGTLIDGSSPVRLIWKLTKQKIMPINASRKAVAWGLRYKLGKELDQSAPRIQVFKSLSKMPATDADAIMEQLYWDELHGLVRNGARECIAAFKEQGIVTVLLSASFEPILRIAARDLGLDVVIGTRMELADGIYTGKMLGAATEGEQKAIQLSDYANETYGPGNWSVDWAFGDHISDVPVMQMAAHPVVIEPNSKLKTYAQDQNWPIYPDFTGVA